MQEFIFSGCKTGGLIEFQEDENKPFISNRINIGNKILTVDLPFEFSAKFKKLPQFYTIFFQIIYYQISKILDMQKH